MNNEIVKLSIRITQDKYSCGKSLTVEVCAVQCSVVHVCVCVCVWCLLQLRVVSFVVLVRHAARQKSQDWWKRVCTTHTHTHTHTHRAHGLLQSAQCRYWLQTVVVVMTTMLLSCASSCPLSASQPSLSVCVITWTTTYTYVSDDTVNYKCSTESSKLTMPLVLCCHLGISLSIRRAKSDIRVIVEIL